MRKETKTTFKIFIELIIFILGVGILYVLIWWLIVDLGQLVFECELYDAGFLKPPGVNCAESSFYENFVRGYAELNVLVFLGELSFFYYFYISLPIVLILSFLISSYLFKIKSKVLERKFFILSFFILDRARMIVKTMKRKIITS